MQNIYSEKISYYEQLLSKTQDNFEKIKIWHEYRNYFSYINPSLSLEIVERGCEFAKTINEEEYFNMLFSKSNSLTQLERFKESYELLIHCFSYFQKNNNSKMLAKILGGISNIFTYLELYPQSIFLLNKILGKYTTEEDKHIRYVISINLIQLYLNKFEDIPYNIEDLDALLASAETNAIKSPHPYLILNITKARLLANKKADYQSAIDIFNETIIKGEEQKVDILVRDAKYFLALCYKNIGDYKNMERVFLNVIQINNKVKSTNHNSDIFFELYNYYSKHNEPKKALEAYEKHQIYSKDRESEKNALSSKINLFGYSSDIDINNALFYSIFTQSNIDSDNTIIITDIYGKNHLIRLQDIIFAEKNIDILKIHLALDYPINTKLNFKDLIEKINSFPSIKKLFFEIQQRSHIVNLFWLNKFDTDKKTVILNAIDKSFEFNISKRQYPIFKKYLIDFNIINNSQLYE